MINIAMINASTVASDDEVAAIVPALQRQVTHDFAPIWNTDALLRFVPRGQQPEPNEWWLTMLDDADAADALGYHDVTKDDKPLGKVFVKTTKQDGGDWHVTSSHELLEMLGDPHIQLAVAVTLDDGQTFVFSYENCDAVEADNLGYEIDGVRVSDFVTPAWFDPRNTTGPFDFKGHVKKPFELLAGGYIGVLSTKDGWTQMTPDRGEHHSSAARYAGNRWHRRRRFHAHGPRRRSTAHAHHQGA